VIPNRWPNLVLTLDSKWMFRYMEKIGGIKHSQHGVLFQSRSRVPKLQSRSDATPIDYYVYQSQKFPIITSKTQLLILRQFAPQFPDLVTSKSVTSTSILVVTSRIKSAVTCLLAQADDCNFILGKYQAKASSV